MAWTASDIPDQSGKVAVVTGASGGLGLESALALGGAGAAVVMAARNVEKAEAACGVIRESHPAALLEIVELDLASLDSVREAAARIGSGHRSIDILINNAGLMAVPEGRTADGFETQLGVNHLGHWVLTARLLPSLLAASRARVVTVTSAARLFARPVDPRDPNLEGAYDPWKAYGQSKLANYHFALGLQREFETRGLRARSFVAHPGLSHTNLQVNTVEQGGGGWSAPMWRWLAARAGMDPSRGALPQLRAATDPGAMGGAMYAPRYVARGVPVRRPILRRSPLGGAIGNLWDVSERLTGERLDFPEVSRSREELRE